MKNINAIEIDFKAAEECAQKLEEYAADLKNISDNEMEEIFSGIQSAWTGDNATAFLAKGTKVQNRIKVSGDHLAQVAATIREIVKNLRETDSKAADIAAQK